MDGWGIPVVDDEDPTLPRLIEGTLLTPLLGPPPPPPPLSPATHASATVSQHAQGSGVVVVVVVMGEGGRDNIHVSTEQHTSYCNNTTLQCVVNKTK